MATASAGRADKGLSRAPARSARPCGAIALRSAGRAGAKLLSDAPSTAKQAFRVGGRLRGSTS